MLNWNFDKQFNNPVIGVDEVGRGPWAGPVVSGAVYIPRGKKKLLPNTISELKNNNFELKIIESEYKGHIEKTLNSYDIKNYDYRNCKTN